MARWGASLVAAALLLAAGTETSRAATVEVRNGVLRYAGGGGRNDVTVVSRGTTWTLTDPRVRLVPRRGCTRAPGRAVMCTGATSAHIRLGAGDDILDGAGARGAIRGEGGDGRDSVNGGSRADRLSGDAGFDDLSGEAGNDLLHGGPDFDDLRGGRGDDRLVGDAGIDVVDGGAGADSIVGDDDELTYATRRRPVRVTLDGRANDGEAGERDNVRGAFSTIRGGNGDDTLHGEGPRPTAADPEPLLVFVIGGPGDDSLFGSAGVEGLYGEDGDDRLRAAGGGDTLGGGDGSDTLTAGAGPDRLSVRDGATDRLLDCGPQDEAFIDPGDARPQDCRETDTDVGGEAGTPVPVLRFCELRNAGKSSAHVRIKVNAPVSIVRVRLRFISRSGRPVSSRVVRVATNRLHSLRLRPPSSAVRVRARPIGT